MNEENTYDCYYNQLIIFAFWAFLLLLLDVLDQREGLFEDQRNMLQGNLDLHHHMKAMIKNKL